VTQKLSKSSVNSHDNSKQEAAILLVLYGIDSDSKKYRTIDKNRGLKNFFFKCAIEYQEAHKEEFHFILSNWGFVVMAETFCEQLELNNESELEYENLVEFLKYFPKFWGSVIKNQKSKLKKLVTSFVESRDRETVTELFNALERESKCNQRDLNQFVYHLFAELGKIDLKSKKDRVENDTKLLKQRCKYMIKFWEDVIFSYGTGENETPRKSFEDIDLDLDLFTSVFLDDQKWTSILGYKTYWTTFTFYEMCEFCAELPDRVQNFMAQDENSSYEKDKDGNLNYEQIGELLKRFCKEFSIILSVTECASLINLEYDSKISTKELKRGLEFIVKAFWSRNAEQK